MQRDSMRKTKTGIVVSAKMEKTVVVAVERLIMHRKYLKAVKRIDRFKARDEEKKCKEGDIVLIVETKPLSKTVRWRVEKILGHKRLRKEKSNDTGTDKA